MWFIEAFYRLILRKQTHTPAYKHGTFNEIENSIKKTKLYIKLFTLASIKDIQRVHRTIPDMACRTRRVSHRLLHIWTAETTRWRKCTKTQFYINNAVPNVKGTSSSAGVGTTWLLREQKKGSNHCQLGHTENEKQFPYSHAQKVPCRLKNKETAQISVRNIPAWHHVVEKQLLNRYPCQSVLTCMFSYHGREFVSVFFIWFVTVWFTYGMPLFF